MPTEIQYGVEAGGRKWAPSRGGKHSNNTMRRRRRWRAEERGGGCPDLQQEMASNGFLAPSPLPSPHYPSVSLALSLLCPLSPLFLCFFPTDALLTELTEVVLRMGCAARLTLLLT